MDAAELLNEKQGSFEEISFLDHKKTEILYQDKVMTISTDHDHIYMSSTWWGIVKNSFFTLDGLKGKTEKMRHGKLRCCDLQNWEKKSPSVSIQKHNKIEISTEGKTELQILGERVQKKFGESLTYEIKGKTGPDHQPIITVELKLPNGQSFEKTGSPGQNKKQVANKIAKKILKENLV